MSLTFKKTISYILLILTIFSMAGCEIKDVSVTEETSVSTTPEPEPQPYPLFIGDVEIEKKPEKIIVLAPALAEIIYEFGFGDSVVGRGSYCDYPPVVLEKPDVGSSTNPDIDTIISLKPEILLTSTVIASKDLMKMDEAGIKTLILPAPKTLDEFTNIYQAIGLIFEGIFTGVEKGDEMYSEIAKAYNNAEAVFIGEFIYITEDLKIATGDTLESAIFSCFGTNLASEYSHYSFELTKLFENEPDVILLNDNYTLEDLKENEIFNALDAVIKEKVVFIDNSVFERPTVRVADMIANFVNEYKKI